MNSLEEMIRRSERRRTEDAKRFAALDDDACQLCDAYGADKRNLIMRCWYDIREVVPEAIDLRGVPEYADVEKHGFFFVRICKSCRASLLSHLREWRDERVGLRGLPKDHDGYLDEFDGDPERNIPYRENGVTVLLTRHEWEARQG